MGQEGEGMIQKLTARVFGAAAMLAAGAALSISAPISAKVTKADDKGFVTRDTAVVEAEPKAVWLALISPSKWWNKAHTWSGDAANLTLRPQAGGCFCERIPEDPDSDEVTLEGSVEHLRVIQAFPEKVLRMRGGLGPLQSEPATGVLTIAIGANEDGEGTRIVWEYVVGGTMRYKVPVIAKVVDGVMTQQLDALAAMLGRIDKRVADDAPAVDTQEEVAGPDEDAPSTGEETKEDASKDRMAELTEAVEALDEE